MDPISLQRWKVLGSILVLLIQSVLQGQSDGVTVFLSMEIDHRCQHPDPQAVSSDQCSFFTGPLDDAFAHNRNSNTYNNATKNENRNRNKEACQDFAFDVAGKNTLEESLHS